MRIAPSGVWLPLRYTTLQTSERRACCEQMCSSIRTECLSTRGHAVHRSIRDSKPLPGHIAECLLAATEDMALCGERWDCNVAGIGVPRQLSSISEEFERRRGSRQYVGFHPISSNAPSTLVSTRQPSLAIAVPWLNAGSRRAPSTARTVRPPTTSSPSSPTRTTSPPGAKYRNTVLRGSQIRGPG